MQKDTQTEAGLASRLTAELGTTSDDFLLELKALLDKYKAAIVRSANDTHDLVVCVTNKNGSFDELIFNEDINSSAIEYKWYAIGE